MKLPSTALLASIALLGCCGGSAKASYIADENDLRLKQAQEVIDWVQTFDIGFFSSKQKIMYAPETAFHSSEEIGIGVFAADDIKKGEVLARIPWEVLITPDPNEINKTREGRNTRGVLYCSTIRKLLAEMRLGDNSAYAPFTSFLRSAPHPPMLPSEFSDAGKDLFQAAVAGPTHFTYMPPQEPTAWIDDDWVEDCGGGTSEEELHAVVMTMTRADVHTLVPIYDFYNHASEVDNVGGRVYHNDYYELKAAYDIEKGHQITVDYSSCPSCDRDERHGAPEMLRDFGFIEDFPQTWHIYFDHFANQRMSFTMEMTSVHLVTSEDQLDESIERNPLDKKLLGVVEWDRGEDSYMTHHLTSWYLRRLGRLYSDELQKGAEDWAFARNRTDLVPQHEWDSVMKYVETCIFVMSHVFYDAEFEYHEDAADEDEDLDNKPIAQYPCSQEVNATCMRNELYHVLYEEPDMPYGRDFSCNIQQLLDFSRGHTTMDFIQTEYQKIWYFKRFPEGKPHDAKLTQEDMEQETDICMKLDEEVQICDSYRPHYHEYAVNYGARYLKKLKRAAFIGGGDSMILQELLKYPDLELVVALELDQTVVRNAFKWFHTDPHFHDDRVEWWFGDATKSLTLLPKEYMNSFDYVMVDVSETGASLTVTRHLDIFNAMSLLVKPDGIMVKNEPYFTQMAKSFDYAVDVLFYHCPMICDQSMIMGSNHIDFFHQDLTDHGVENLLLPEIEDYPHDYFLWRDYKNTDPNEDGSCEKLRAGIEHQKEEDDEERSGKSAGLVMVVEVEHVTIPMKDVESVIMRTLKALGYTSIISEDNTEDGFDVVVMTAEAYVVARRWPKHNYVALDIHSWGRFEKLEDTREALVKALGSGNDVKKGSASSFRVVASGMYGNDSYEEDSELIGPDLTKHTRNCDGHVNENVEALKKARAAESPASTVTDQPPIELEDIVDAEFVKTTLDAIVDNLANESSTVLVFCDTEDKPCEASATLQEHSRLAHVVTLHACENIKDMEFVRYEKQETDKAARINALHECRAELEQQIKKVVIETRSIIGGAIFDADAPYGMARAFSSFFTFRRNIFQDTTIQYFASFQRDTSKDAWRREVVREIHRVLEIDPLIVSELIVKPVAAQRQDPGAAVHVVSVDVEDTFPRIRSIEDAIADKYSDRLAVFPTYIEGGGLMYTHDFSPIEFKQSDYDLSAEIEQYKKQVAFGRQTVFQFTRDQSRRGADGVSPNLDSIMAATLESTNAKIESAKSYDKIGKGMVEVVRFKEGNAVAVFDGENHITINLFRFDQRRSRADEFMTRFLASMVNGGWRKELRDDMPRGINRVINFSYEHK